MRTLLITTVPLAVLLLAACELRQNDDEATDPATQATSSTQADAGSLSLPEPDPEETEVASIIRDDALPGPALELLPEPLRETIPFAQGGSDLSPAAERVLNEVLQSPALEQSWPIVLRGHTDAGGNDRANLRASRARAEAVAAWLVDHGVDDERIAIIAIGEQNPLAPNALPDGEPNEPGRARNRRVAIEIAPPRAQPPNPTATGARESAADTPAARRSPS